MATKIIDNFGGRLVRDDIGDMNSGLAKYPTTSGADPFSKIGNLTWQESAIQIDPSGNVITDLIVAGKERVENGVSYLYAVGHLGRVYKIQINDPTTFNPNYDNPVLLTTLTINSPTFTRGGSVDFFGTTERMYIGSDMGVTQLDFAGTGETFVGSTSSWVQNVPRPVKQFVGKMYFGNGSNLAEIDSSLLVTTYTKLSPGFPSGTQVRDIDSSSDGNYLEMVVTRLALPDITVSTQDTTLISNSESYIFKWNGIDMGYTAFTTYPSFSLNANSTFGDYQYVFGYDLAGACVYNPTKKILSVILGTAPLPNAVGSNGNLVGWIVPEFYNGFLRASSFIYGSLDNEVGVGWWRQLSLSATGSETDIIRVPFQTVVSNLFIGSVTNGYPGGVVGCGKAYFSTLETSVAPTKKYKFYKWFPVPTGTMTSVQGVYETQNQTSFRLFRSLVERKFSVQEVRIYTSPLVANNSFQIDLIGGDGNPIPGTTKVFTAGIGATAIGSDRNKYNPQMPPVYSLGVRITNLGAANWTGAKIELDYAEAGN